MLRFLADYWGTIVIGAVLAAIVIGIIIKLFKNRKNGKSSCSCGCEQCPSSCACHKK